MTEGEKEWLASYSVRHIDGKVEESEINVPGRNIDEALKDAKLRLANAMAKDPEVSQIVIWSIGIVKDTFSEEEDE